METNTNISVEKFVVITLIVVLFAGNIFIGYRYFNARNELSQEQTIVKNIDTHAKVLAFGKLFVEKVLMNQNAVDFNTRLQLENEVRATNDSALINQWQTFVASQNETDAQATTVKLLDLILQKA